jgi:undecaprenyl diphosphate synthase
MSAEIDPLKVPKHIAIVMDGNRRWAKARGLPSIAGHWKGAEIVSEIVRTAAQLGVKILTAFAFSTENWTRSEEEIDALMNILEQFLLKNQAGMVRDGVRLETIGDLSRLPSKVINALNQVKEATKAGAKITFVLALNYGARDEIRRAVIKIVSEKILPEEITEKMIAEHLDTAHFPDPDLLIRTSGEMRLSNFLLWQVSYTELFSTEVLWPDFSPKDLFEAVIDFQRRNRRLGG